MRPVLALTLMASSFYAADLRIDHVTLAGQSLDSMREAFTAATGIRTEYGGSHANHVTEMALASFPDGSYIELMGIQGGADPATAAAHTWGRFLRNEGGPCAFALRVSDVTTEVELLKKAARRQKLKGAGEPVPMASHLHGKRRTLDPAREDLSSRF